MKKCYIHFVIVVFITVLVLLMVAITVTTRGHHDCRDASHGAYWEDRRPGCLQRKQPLRLVSSGATIGIGDSTAISCCCCCYWVLLVFIIATDAVQARPSARLTIVGS